jgi:hypothetical protein
MRKVDRTIGLQENRHFVRRKLVKIEDNCDDNIDPRQLKKEISKLSELSCKIREHC